MNRHGHRGHRHGHGGHFAGRGFFGRGGGHGGPGMRAARMLASGDLQLVILQLLAEKSRHGYEIIKALEDHSHGFYTPSPGMVYPALTYLEETGFATATAEGSKKLYDITAQGRAHLGEHAKDAREIMDHLAEFGAKMKAMRERAAHDEAEEEQWARQEWRELREEFRELVGEVKSAIFATIQAPMEEKRRVLGVLRRALEDIRRK